MPTLEAALPVDAKADHQVSAVRVLGIPLPSPTRVRVLRGESKRCETAVGKEHGNTMGTNDYLTRHRRAWNNATNPWTKNVKTMILAWAGYAQTHRAAYGSPIGEDYVLGEHWKDIGRSLLGLLNGECGPDIDCGTLDSAIRGIMRDNAVDPETGTLGVEL